MNRRHPALDADPETARAVSEAVARFLTALANEGWSQGDVLAGAHAAITARMVGQLGPAFAADISEIAADEIRGRAHHG